MDARNDQRSFKIENSDAPNDIEAAPSKTFSQGRRGGSRGGRARGRGRGFNSPKIRTSSDATLVSPAPTIVAPATVPKPKALSTTSSVLRNDPMLEDALVGPDGPTLTPINLAPVYYPTLCSLDSLVDEIYVSISGIDKNFRQNITKSMLAYYCQQHLMARVIAIRLEQGNTSHSENQFLSGMKHGLYPVPGVLDSYFRSLGEFTMLNGTRFHISLPDYSRVMPGGGWGRVDHITQVEWMNYPHAFTYAYRLQQDIIKTQTPIADSYWDLPAAIRPVALGVAPQPIIEPGLPTANLCGWHPSVGMSSNQTSILSNAGISTVGFRYDGFSPVFKHNKELMHQVALRLHNVDKSYAIAPGPHLSLHGSIGQEPKVKVGNNNDYIFSRELVYSNSAPVKVTSLELLDPRMAWASAMFTYRIIRETIHHLDAWSCYDWDDYTNVPQNWINNRNDLLNRGIVDLINIEQLQSAAIERRSLIARACKISEKVKDPT